MVIYDNDGTASAAIGKLYDNDGTANTRIGKVYDNNETTDSLIYKAKHVLIENGVLNTADAGDGFTLTYQQVTSSVSYRNGYIELYTTSSGNVVGYGSYVFNNRKQPLKDYDTLYIDYSASVFFNASELVSAGGKNLSTGSTSRTTKTLNISGVNDDGSIELRVRSWVNTNNGAVGATRIYIYNLWLE